MAYTVFAIFAGETSVCVPVYDDLRAALARAVEETGFGYRAVVVGDDGTRVNVVGETHDEAGGTTGVALPGGSY